MEDRSITEGSEDFGFKQVTAREKTRRVKAVFSSVAGNYDLMNDLMSGGLHRLWKYFAVHISQVKAGDRVLDLAGGTGDLAMLFRDRVGSEGRVCLSDINTSMLQEGKQKLINNGYLDGIDYVLANAENLPFNRNSFDCISIAFGLRNITFKEKALSSMYYSLKYGGEIIILEFSKLVLPVLERLYNEFSFKIIPELGSWVSNDRGSYQYLVESIRKHPDQVILKKMMETAGFERVCFYNLLGGIVAVHKGYKI